MNTPDTRFSATAITAFLLTSTGMFAAIIVAVLTGPSATVATAAPVAPVAEIAAVATPPVAKVSASSTVITTGRDTELIEAAKNADLVKQGRDSYASFCKSCHGEEKSQSSEAPSNLFDSKWYHGGRPAEIEQTMLKGIAEKGMPGWGEVLPADDTTALTAYLLSFQK